jgi:hypothetical protein
MACWEVCIKGKQKTSKKHHITIKFEVTGQSDRLGTALSGDYKLV